MNSYSFATILCPVDFSEISAHALRAASLLATCGNATLVAAYANWFEAPPYFTEAQIGALEREIRESAQDAESTSAASHRSRRLRTSGRSQPRRRKVW